MKHLDCLLLSCLIVGSVGVAACGSSDSAIANEATGSGSGAGGSSSTTTGSSSGTTTSTGTTGPSGTTTSTSGSGGASTTSSTTGSGASTTTSTGSGGNTGFTTVFTIVLENHDYSSIVGSSDAPYINSLISQYGLATNYMDSGAHPSLPNYLYMVSGATQYPGFVDLDPTTFPFPVAGDNLGDQLEAAGIAWRSYQESMGTPCSLAGSGEFAPKHDPFLYFDSIQNGTNGLCAQRNVDYSSFAADLASGTYSYMWITPNLLDDGHDPSSDPSGALQQSDAWLSSEVPKILASAAYKAGGVIFLTWDEGEGLLGTTDHVPMIIISPKLKSPGYQSAQPYNHASFLATIEEIFNLPKLGAAANAQSLMEFFQ